MINTIDEYFLFDIICINMYLYILFIGLKEHLIAIF